MMVTTMVKISSLKIDPSRTATLRRAFVSNMTRRFKKLAKKVQALVVANDVFGLEVNEPFVLQAIDAQMRSIKYHSGLQVNRQEWRFRNDAEKVTEFRSWLQGEVDSGILTSDGLNEPWTNEYVGSSYKKGFGRGYTDVNKVPGFQSGFTKDEFLNSAFNQPEVLSKIELIYTRTFSELKGVTDAMGQVMSRTLAGGLAAGAGPRVIARNLRKDIQTITKRRALVLARTEVIRAHAEGQLDSYQRLGITTVDVMAEWSTAGDDRVCPQCAALEGEIMTIDEARGTIPLHPNCRCAWKPYMGSRGKAKRELK